MDLRCDPSELVGHYFHRLAHSRWSLELKEDGHYSSSWGACLGDSHRTGTWVLDGDTVILQPDPTEEDHGLPGLGCRYLPVKWGNRHLLVEENRMPAFCASARAQTPPTEALVDGLDFVKVISPDEAPGEGAPIIPDLYRQFYEMGPIRAEVVGINSDGTVLLDPTAATRLLPGMRLVGLPRGCGYEDSELEVISVDHGGAIARAYYFLHRSERQVQVGDPFTTGQSHWYPYMPKEERLTELPPPPPKVLIQHRETGAVLETLRVHPSSDCLWFGGEDLHGADLRVAAPGSDLPLTLVKAHLSYARLQGATMAGQDMRQAELSRSCLDGADLSGANLLGSFIHEASLRSALLAGANLLAADLQQSDLREADFTGARLRGALLCGADLRGADLTGADLTEVKLIFARYDSRTRWPDAFDAAAARRGPGLAVQMRNCASFQLDREKREAIPQSGSGPAEEVRSFLARQVARRGVRLVDDYYDWGGSISYEVDGHSRGWDQGFAYSFRCRVAGRVIHVMVGAVGGSPWEDDAQWLVSAHPLEGPLSRLLRLRGEGACRVVCSALDAVLKSDGPFTNIRWHTEEAWNSEPDRDWSATP